MCPPPASATYESTLLVVTKRRSTAPYKLTQQLGKQTRYALMANVSTYTSFFTYFSL